MENIITTPPPRARSDAEFNAAFCVPIEVKPSATHGDGVHAVEPIRKGTIICNLFRSPDVYIVSEAQITEMWNRNPEAAVLVTGRIYGDYFAYGTYMDAECFLNHSDEANAINFLGQTIALRDIAAGEEIMINYRFIFAPDMYITTDKGRIYGYTAAEAREQGDRIMAGLLGNS